MKKYLVCFVTRHFIGGDTVDMSEYQVFVDGDTSEENLKAAKGFYNNKVKKKSTYSCNLCEIIQSTDY